MIHYHGGVINERRSQASFADEIDDWGDILGRSFCVSYAYPDRLELYHQIGQSVMLDNGAYSLWQQGKDVDWEDFYKWCEPWLDYWTTWAIIPDVINGGEEENDQLLAQWPHGDRGAPVWHIDESLERLARLVYEWPLVCLGSAREYEPLGGPAWTRKMAEAMDVACDERGVPRTRLHLLRGLAFGGGPYPLYSADSATAARSRGGSPQNGVPGKPLGKLLNEIDARQTPARWLGSQQTVYTAEADPGAYTNPFVTGMEALDERKRNRKQPLGERPQDEGALF